MSDVRLITGDNVRALSELADNSLDAILTDPPYGLRFMGKRWDYEVPTPETFAAFLRILKPGGHMLAFGGSRTCHRMTVSIEDAGFEIRDVLMWIYGSGFPKSLDVSKAIDKELGAEREVVGKGQGGGDSQRVAWNDAPGVGRRKDYLAGEFDLTTPATDQARQFEGYGTALKPAYEPIILARKPPEDSIARNVLKWGTGGINIDGCRVGHASEADRRESEAKNQHSGYANPNSNRDSWSGEFGPRESYSAPAGRFPANILHDGSPEVLEAFAAFGESRSSDSKSLNRVMTSKGFPGGGLGQRKANDVGISDRERIGYDDAGSPSRFFYSAKPSGSERSTGLSAFLWVSDPNEPIGWRRVGQKEFDQTPERERRRGNIHPTVKPVELLRYLARLITPAGGTLLDPFLGSGSSGVAAVREGFDFVGVDLFGPYVDIARARIDAAVEAMATAGDETDQLGLFEGE